MAMMMIMTIIVVTEETHVCQKRHAEINALSDILSGSLILLS